MLYSVIIPCYRSDQTIRKVVELTMKQFESMGIDHYEFVLVDDASPDGGKTVAQLRGLVRDYECVRVIELARNSGQHNAVMAGLNYAMGDIIIAMDDDMQCHPSQLPPILDELDKGYDIVYGYYPVKKESGFRRFGSFVNHETVRILLDKPRDMKTSSFWAIRRFVRDYAIQYPNESTHLQGVFLRITRNIGSVPIQHFEREVGKSGYTFKKLVKLWSNIIGFSIVPLRMATWFGFGFSVFGLVLALWSVIRKLVRPVTAIGWPSMMAAICFFSGINLLFMGLIGEYIGRIFLGISHNPQYVVRQIDTHDGIVTSMDIHAPLQPDLPSENPKPASAGGPDAVREDKDRESEGKPERVHADAGHGAQPGNIDRHSGNHTESGAAHRGADSESDRRRS